MGHVPHGPEHDVDDAPRGNAKALKRRLSIRLAAFNIVALLVVAGLCALGLWQIQRRAWKLDLIERVERRIQEQPTAAPGPELWAAISAQSDEYRRVSVTGHWLPTKPALVQASTVLGAGYWVMAAFARDDGSTVFINRGFIPPSAIADRHRWQPVGGETATVTGLLRPSMPKGGFLRTNNPAEDRWYSRDVAEIAAARGIARPSPYFIDAERSDEAGIPVGGLTVLSFTNNHLLYAITWIILAIMAVASIIFVNLDVHRRTGERSRRDIVAESE